MICCARNDEPHVLVDSPAGKAHSPRRGKAEGWIGSCRNASSIKANAIRNPEQFPQCKRRHSRFVRPKPVFAPVFAAVFDAAPGFDCSPLNTHGLTEIWEQHAPAALGALWAPGWEALSGFWDALTLLFHLKHVLSSPSPFFFSFLIPILQGDYFACYINHSHVPATEEWLKHSFDTIPWKWVALLQSMNIAWEKRINTSSGDTEDGYK